jgi:hypothetical protein
MGSRSLHGAVSRVGARASKTRGIEVRQPLMIETASEATAQCIAEALAEFETALQNEGERWAVRVDHDEFEVAPLFSALEECLSANGIHAVHVTFGKRKYLMVPSL